MKHCTRVHVIATQHLDVAWLWTRSPYGEELMRQCFERAVEMIHTHRDVRFVFSRSTAWSFWIVEQRYPELFKTVRELVADGRIELCGGEWVEPDHLMPDGESLVRQCALGQWYFLERFGRCASVCWDPDIFGHPHSLPQILRKSGMEGFYSHRCRPRSADGRPLHQFVWEGPDGSRVFYLAGPWIGAPEPETIRPAVENAEAASLPAAHVVTGLCSDRRITMQRAWVRMPASAASIPDGSCCAWSTASEVLDDMKTYVERLPVIRGELGFQYTGTYTSNGENKRTNRRVESLLVNAEKAAAWASTYGFRYPREQLTRAWRAHCVNQFHDIICGCSIAEVDEEDRELWADAGRRATYARDEALSYLCDRIHAGLSASATGDGEILAVFNLLSWSRASTIELDLRPGEELEAASSEGRPLPVQIGEAGGRAIALVGTPPVAGIGHELLHVRRRPSAEPAAARPSVGEELVLENDHVRVDLDPGTGELAHLVDKRTGTDSIPPAGRGNRFVFLGDAHESMPAWSIRYTGETLDPGEVRSVEVVERGPIRRTVRVVRTVRLAADLPPTTIVQDITLYADSPILHFATRGEWHASSVFLKTEFDLAFQCRIVAAEAPYAAAERGPNIGVAARKADTDTMAEDAKSSAATPDNEPDRYMQKWLDVSDGDRGLLFLNDGLYGYDAAEHRVRLSLLRAPFEPGKRRRITGLGPFAFSYAVLPHTKGWREVDAPRLGYEFNNPLIVRPVRDGFDREGVWRDWWDTRASAPQHVCPGFVSLDGGDGSMVTAVKRAEDGEGIVLRVVETRGAPDSVAIRCYRPVTSAVETDLLERAAQEQAEQPRISSDGTEIALTMSPWEIKTIRIVF